MEYNIIVQIVIVLKLGIFELFDKFSCHLQLALDDYEPSSCLRTKNVLMKYEYSGKLHRTVMDQEGANVWVWIVLAMFPENCTSDTYMVMGSRCRAYKVAAENQH